MKILAISGSARVGSTNTALLKTMQAAAPQGVEMQVFHELHTFPVFSPDLEGDNTPSMVNDFLERVSHADALIISSPEYVRAIPGGLKNAIDWMVSRFDVIGKPIALVHASHRGDDMLASLRLVLATITDQFLSDVFLRIPLIGKTSQEIHEYLQTSERKIEIDAFFEQYIAVVYKLDNG